MGKPIPYDYRCLIIKKRKLGQSFVSISQEIDCSLSGIKKIWYAYKKEGDSSLKTNYHNCGRPTTYTCDVLDKVNKIRTGKQGASFVHSMYKMKNPKEQVPSISTIQRMWQKEKTNRPRGRPRTVEKKAGQQNHFKLFK